MSTATETAPARNRVQLPEIILLLLICGGMLVLLLPSLAASREHARANLCRRNLRWLDQATAEYGESMNRLPDAVTWPVDLLSLLQDRTSSEKPKASTTIFSQPRPAFYTCPSQMMHPESRITTNGAHYEFIVDRSKRQKWNETSWRFRDRELAPVVKKVEDWWCVGVEFTGEEAKRQLMTTQGPHADFSFLESNSLGESEQVGRGGAK